MSDIKEWVPATSWLSVAGGAEVKLTLHENHVVGTRAIGNFTALGMRVIPNGAGGDHHNWFYESDGWLLQVVKPVVVLPTELGWYWDKDGDPVEMEFLNDRLDPELAPYTRIRKEAEVAADLKRALTDEFTGFTGISPRVLEVIDRVCGVTE